jgi:hypothetical protein
MRMVITLNEQERQALTKIAGIEVRDPRDQIRYWLRQDAQARGLLPDDRPLTGSGAETAVKVVQNDGQ